jgi:replication factor A1
MAIKDLQAKQGNANVVATVISKENAREFQKFGKPGKVCNALIKDETGEVKLTLWNEQIDSVNVGDKIEVKNGYVNEWQGEKQLSTGKFGSLEVLEKAAAQIMAEEKKEATTEKTEQATKVYTNVPQKEFMRLDVEEEELGDYDEDY